MISEQTRERAGRHALEVVVVLLATAVFSHIGVFPRFTGVPSAFAPWVVPAAFLLGSVIIVVAYTTWDADSDYEGMRTRVLVQSGVLSAITYLTGWGFALPLVHLFAVADNVKYAGSQAVRPAVQAALWWTLVGQLFLTFGLVPSVGRSLVIWEEGGSFLTTTPSAGFFAENDITPPIPDLATWGIAAFMIMAVIAVSARIRQMTMAREEAQEEVANSEARFRALVEDSEDVVLLVRDGLIAYHSPSVTRVLGYESDEVLGASYLSYVHPDDRDETIARVHDLLERPDSAQLIECRLQHSDGHWIHVETSARNLTGDRLVRGFVLNVRDSTQRKALEAELEHRAFHDSLTGLPNRTLFRDRVDHLVTRAGRTDIEAAVLYLDLDGFKVVNDTLGHAAGDAVLVAAAERIREAVRDSDTPARLGGDEFAVLLEDLDREDGAGRVAERILSSMRRPIRVGTTDVRVDCSIGVALLRRGWTGEEFIRNADIAMYMAKSAGKSRYEVFEASMHASMVERLEIERDLERALANDEFVLHYQPIVDLADQRLVGVEALVRWEHPVRGLVGPSEFISIAEESGAIIPMGRWVLREALRQTMLWQDRHPLHPSLQVSINVSMRQLAHPDLVQDVAAAIADTGIAADKVVLELTETSLVRDTEHTARVLAELKALGVRLAIDDFGTGYSSLSYLQRFPLDILKIDRSFVEGVVRGTQSPALVRAIIDMSRSLDLETVAEGIERDEELQRVRAMRCTWGQGHLFARPAPATEVEERIAAASAAMPRVMVDLDEAADADRGAVT